MTIAIYDLLLLICYYMRMFQCSKWVLLVSAWCCRYNDISFTGSKQIQTPNIDRLGDEGIFLSQFYVQPTCSPTRASLLTVFLQLFLATSFHHNKFVYMLLCDRSTGASCDYHRHIRGLLWPVEHRGNKIKMNKIIYEFSNVLVVEIFRRCH